MRLSRAAAALASRSVVFQRRTVRLKIAVLALLPDSGHVIPLLKIGAMLVDRGHQVTCLLPDEAAALANTYELPSIAIGTALSPIALEAMQHFGGSSIFTTSLDVYYRDYHAAIFARSTEMVETSLRKLESWRPDLLLVDNHQFTDVFGAIGARIDAPVVFHDSAGGVHSRSGAFSVMLYGHRMSRWREFAIAAGGLLYNLSREVARIRRFRRHGLYKAIATARERLRKMLPAMPSSGSPWPATSTGVMSAASEHIEHHFATGLGLLERRMRGTRLLPDRSVFGPILSICRTTVAPDLARWLDAHADESVVFVSFGSMVTLGENRLQTLRAACSAIGGPVLWALKGGRNALADLSVPSNVRVEAFVPQPLLLGHPAIGVCVTHGGIGTVLESLAEGVPLVMLPVIWDQAYNAELVQELGAGLRLNWWGLNDAALTRTVSAVLRAPEYRRRARAIAAELHAEEGSDQVVAFLENVVSAQRADSWARVR
jgi:UDP:flavonoid glycosyltransferase YjiC (YdhE family)